MAETTADDSALFVARRGESTDLYLTCTPDPALGSPERQARRMAEAIERAVSEHSARIVQERVFGRLDGRDAYLSARSDALGGALAEAPWPLHYIEGAPILGGTYAGVHVYAVAGAPTRTLRADGQPVGVEVASDGLGYHYLGGIAGTPAGAEPAAQCEAMFRRAESLLGAESLRFDRVARTWLYLNRILEWYSPLNEVRTRLYGEWRLGGPGMPPLPASTGILGRVEPSVACSMDLVALSGDRRDEAMVQLHNPAQNEAYSYGSSFSRGMAISDGGLTTAYISGTAAIDEHGRSIHENDIAAQTECTLDKIAALLGTCGMDLDDVVNATLFVKRRGDGETVRALCAARSARLAHGSYVLADVCRDELLFEAEVTALERT